MRGHGQPSIEPSGHGQYGERSWSLVSLHRGLWLDHNRTAVRGHGQWSAIHRGLRSGTRTYCTRNWTTYTVRGHCQPSIEDCGHIQRTVRT